MLLCGVCVIPLYTGVGSFREWRILAVHLYSLFVATGEVLSECKNEGVDLSGKRTWVTAAGSGGGWEAAGGSAGTGLKGWVDGRTIGLWAIPSSRPEAWCEADPEKAWPREMEGERGCFLSSTSQRFSKNIKLLSLGGSVKPFCFQDISPSQKVQNLKLPSLI